MNNYLLAVFVICLSHAPIAMASVEVCGHDSSSCAPISKGDFAAGFAWLFIPWGAAIAYSLYGLKQMMASESILPRRAVQGSSMNQPPRIELASAARENPESIHNSDEAIARALQRATLQRQVTA